MSEYMNRAQRRELARSRGGNRQRLKKGLVAATAVAAFGAGTVMAPAGQAFGAPLASSTDLAGMDLGAIMGMIDDPMVSQFVEMCRTGGLATGPDSSKSTEFDPDNRPLAVADCSKSNGTGIALVLPESLEMGQAAEGMTMDLGDDINLLLVKYRMGERNLIEVLGGVVLGSDIIKGAAKGLVGIPVDPGAFDKYSSYEAIQRDAALPVEMETYCDGVYVFNRCVGTWKQRDKNLAKRTEALKMAEYLSGAKYDPTKQQQLPNVVRPIGTSVIEGAGINVALSMRGGNALAKTGNDIALALAGADKGRTSSAYAQYGIASAVNMDTDDITFTWFGQKVDFKKLRDSGLLTSDLAGEAGADAAGMLDMVEGLQLPGLKEVACFGVNTSATAEGLGSCTNFLGTFDQYTDLRAATDGGHRQTQYGITDVTSVFMGNDALLKQLAPMLGGDTSGLMDSPFMKDMLAAMLSEDQRIKFAKDFIRYTKDVETTFAKEPVLDELGNPVLDDQGNPKMKVKTTARMVGATEIVDEQYDKPVMVQDKDADGNDLWVDAAGKPVAEGTEGALPKLVQKLDAAGNPVTEKKTRKVTKPVMVDELDAEGNQVWVNAAGTVVAAGTEGAVKKQTQKIVQATDHAGKPVFDPVIEKTTTAHWLTSDYGLREPLVIQWLGNEIVFFPPVEVNGTTRPNLIGLPQIRKITGDAQSGLLPKISLVQWDNAFGLGTVSLNNPFNPFTTMRDHLKTVTVLDDLKGVGDLVGQLTNKPKAETPVEEPAADAKITTMNLDVDVPEAKLPPVEITESKELPAIEIEQPKETLPPVVVAPAPSENAPSSAPEPAAPAAEESAPAATEAPAASASAAEPELELSAN